MVEQHSGAPARGEITRIGQFVLARLRENVQRREAAWFDSEGGGEQRNQVDHTLALQATVLNLIAAPPSWHRADSTPAHAAAVDSAKRRTNYGALAAMANDYRMHPDWDPEWQQ